MILFRVIFTLSKLIVFIVNMYSLHSIYFGIGGKETAERDDWLEWLTDVICSCKNSFSSIWLTDCNSKEKRKEVMQLLYHNSGSRQYYYHYK